MPPRGRGRARGRGTPIRRGRGGSTIGGVTIPIEPFSPATTAGEPESDGEEEANHLEGMLSSFKAHGGTLQIKPWRGGQGFGEFRSQYRQQAIGAGWRGKEQVLRLVGFLGGLPAIKYMKWLEDGSLVNATLEQAFQKLAREFFDEEEEKHAEKERWMNRKQKPDELVEEYHTIFVANADRAGITDEKEILRQWCRNLLPSIRVAVQTARSSNPALTLQSAVRIAIDVQTSFEEGEPQTAYHHGPEDQGYEEKGVKKVRAIASAAAESVVKSMEAEIAQARRELQKAKEEILSLRQQKEPSQSEMRMARRWEPYRGRGGQTSSSWKRDGYKSQKRQYEDAKQLRRCERCLMFGHQQNECFYDGVCFKCGKQGHKAVACKVRGAPEEQARRSSQQTEDTSVRPKGN